MRTASLILIALFIFGCEKSDDSPSFPAANQISQLSISGGIVVNEQAKISELILQLSKIEEQWSYTAHTYPTPQAQIKFIGSSGQVLCYVDIGPNWVGSNCGVGLKSNWPPFVTINKEQALFFREIAAGKWEIK